MQELTQYVTGWVDACLKAGVRWQLFTYIYGGHTKTMMYRFGDKSREEHIQSIIARVIDGGFDDSEIKRTPTKDVGVYNLERIKPQDVNKYQLPEYKILIPQSQAGVEEDHERKPAAE